MNCEAGIEIKWKERVEFLNYLFSDERVCDHFLKDDGWREC